MRDMKQVPYRGSTNIRHNRTKFSGKSDKTQVTRDLRTPDVPCFYLFLHLHMSLAFKSQYYII
jgi:hypothetical protein